MDISHVSSSGGLFYTSADLSIGHFDTKGVIFSAGDIVIKGNSSMTGVLMALNDIYYTKGNSMSVTYSQDLVNAIKSDSLNSFFFGSIGSGTVPTSDVIQGQSITAAGRTN